MPKPTPIPIDVLDANGWKPELVTSSDQRASQDLPAAVTPEGEVVSCWRLDDYERQAIASGADLYVFQRTHGRPFQPLSIVTGPTAAAKERA